MSNIDKFGRVSYSEDELMDCLLLGKDISGLSSDFETVKKFNMFNKKFDKNFGTLQEYHEEKTTIKEFDVKRQNTWFIPPEYLNKDMEKYLLSKCNNNFELSRVFEELILYKKYNKMIVLNVAKYLVDVMRGNNIVWGVGRGSSISSFCLFLIGLHKVNSLKYNIDIKEFLKDD